MVCEKCEKKLSKVICPDVYREGDTRDKRKLNENKLLTSKSSVISPTISNTTRSSAGPDRRERNRERFNPYARKCKICKSKISLQGAYYCQDCAYKKGICAMCGKKVLDTSSYRQSAV